MHGAVDGAGSCWQQNYALGAFAACCISLALRRGFLGAGWWEGAVLGLDPSPVGGDRSPA